MLECEPAESLSSAVQAAKERDIIVVTLTGRNDGPFRDEVQLMGEQETKAHDFLTLGP